MEIFDAIKRNSFIVLGRVGMDLFADTGIAIEDATTFNADMGGSSANIAAGIAKLGGKASLVTRVSDDAVGRFCVGKLKHYGVGCEYVIPQGGEARNSLAVYETRLEGHQSVIYRNGAADFEMTVADVEAVNYSQFGALIAAGTVFAAEPSRSAAFRAFELARAAGLPIIFDVDYRPYSWPSAKVAEDVLSRAGTMSDVIIGNDDEFGFMAGSKDAGLDMARRLASTSAQIVVYKMGEHGAVTCHKGVELRTGVYTVDAVKPTGAGDSFMAGFLTSIADGHDLHTALLRGSACAAIVVGKPGCAPAMPYPDELDTFLTNHPGPTLVA